MAQPATPLSQSPADEPAGRYYYAPQVRLLVGDGGDGTDPVVLPPTGDSNDVSHPVHCDIERAEVTQVHHGPSQASITLNNHRHEDTSRPRPVSPPWKYNAFDPLSFGQRLKIQFGYAIGTERGNTDNSQENLMVRARVTDMTYVFPTGGGAKITLKAEDSISLLNAKADRDTRFADVDEVQMVRQVLGLSNSGLSLAAGQRETVSGTIRELTLSRGQSYYRFIEEFAKRLDYEIWVDMDEPNSLHFEKARSRTLDTCFDLLWGRDLLDFKPKFKGWDIYTVVSAGGSHPRRRAPVRETVRASEIAGELHTAPGGDTPISAVEARERYFSNGHAHNLHSIDTSNLDEGRVELLATAALRRSAREFLTADATVIGSPNIRPGLHVNIGNLEAPFDGIYYVTKAVHTIDNSGYQTKLSLRRPGMLDPSLYPFAPA